MTCSGPPRRSGSHHLYAERSPSVRTGRSCRCALGRRGGSFAGSGLAGHSSSGGGPLWIPPDIAFDDAGKPYVADFNNTRVQIVVRQGATSVVIIPGETAVPGDLKDEGRCEDVNSNGRIDFADVAWVFDNLSPSRFLPIAEFLRSLIRSTSRRIRKRCSLPSHTPVTEI